MKKLIFTLAIMLGLATTVSAQEIGQMWVGGSVGFSSSKSGDSDRVTSYKIIPEIGYVFAENMGVGIRLGYAHNQVVPGAQDEDGFAISAKDAFIVNPFLRYSFLKGDIGGLFIDAGGAYSHYKFEGDGKADAFEVGFRPGVAVKVSDKIALTGKFGFLGYQHSKIEDVKSDAFGFDFDLGQTELGVSIVF